MAADAPSTLNDPEHEQRLAWITKVRSLHRSKRLIGFAGIILGASMLLWWKFTPTAPDWSMWGGIAALAVSWILFIYVIWDRWRWVRNNPYKPR
jgi:hypothetical protein